MVFKIVSRLGLTTLYGSLFT